MDFDNNRSIYLQMADRLCDEILAGTYGDDERLPGLREYALLLQVNTNTAVKAYETLARENIIYNKRGLGFYVVPGAAEHIRQAKHEAFLHHELPRMFRQMKLIGIGIDEVVGQWRRNRTADVEGDAKSAGE